MYNGVYRWNAQISVTASHHDTCLMMSNRIKCLCQAWAVEVTFQESKSARKGSVLRRNIAIKHEAIGLEIMIFEESLKIVCEKIRRFGLVDIYKHGSNWEQAMSVS